MLERLGIDECAKAGCDSIRVDGYVVIQPGSESSGPTTLPLTYPIADPANLKQFMGVRSPDEHSNNSPKVRCMCTSVVVLLIRCYCIRVARSTTLDLSTTCNNAPLRTPT